MVIPEAIKIERRWFSTDIYSKILSDFQYANISLPENFAFHPFPRLPFELRTHIWQYACHWPTTLEVERATIYEPFPEVPQSRPLRYRSRNPPPLLHTSHESRMIMLQVLKDEQVDNKAHGGLRPKSIRYNLDIVHLQDIDFALEGGGCSFKLKTNVLVYYGRPMCFKFIQTLALDYKYYAQFVLLPRSPIRYFFPNLRVLVLLIDGTDHIWNYYRMDNSIWTEDREVEKWATLYQPILKGHHR